jgi:hypothetical protein
VETQPHNALDQSLSFSERRQGIRGFLLFNGNIVPKVVLLGSCQEELARLIIRSFDRGPDCIKKPIL